MSTFLETNHTRCYSLTRILGSETLGETKGLDRHTHTMYMSQRLDHSLHPFATHSPHASEHTCPHVDWSSTSSMHRQRGTCTAMKTFLYRHMICMNGLVSSHGEVTYNVKRHWMVSKASAILRNGIRGSWGWFVRSTNLETWLLDWNILKLLLNGLQYVEPKSRQGEESYPSPCQVTAISACSGLNIGWRQDGSWARKGKCEHDSVNPWYTANLEHLGTS